MEERQGFKSSFGMIMAAVGSAVGVGNIWRFPYITGKYGGGAFLISYLILIFIIGIPLMISEMVIGRRGGKDAVGSFKNLAPGKKWYFSGVIGVIAAFIILGYYSVVAGWSLKYVVQSATNAFAGKNPEGVTSLFNDFITNPLEPIVYMVVFMSATIYIVSKGVQGGIEKASKILLPILFAILILLAASSLTLEKAMEGVKFLFKPDFSTLDKEAILVAMGHAFYTLSLGMGIMITYGSYIGKKQNLVSTAIKITIMDTVVALLAGLAIFPAVFTFGLEPTDGAGLVFTTLPNVFSQMSFGYIFGLLFFILLSFAALTSTISLLEVVVAYLVDSKNMERKKASLTAGLGIIIVGIISSLSMGNWSGITILGKNFFDFFDYLTANFLLLIAALIEVIFLGWVFKKEDLLDEVTNQGSVKFRLEKAFYFVIKYVAPIAIIVIFLFTNNIFNF